MGTSLAREVKKTHKNFAAKKATAALRSKSINQQFRLEAALQKHYTCILFTHLFNSIRRSKIKQMNKRGRQVAKKHRKAIARMKAKRKAQMLQAKKTQPSKKSQAND
ncbi:MAG: hypothetical protein CMR00_02925 [[Chlorobium] sp. 445]|nr:MAG: hypothetical protein CMR00_02925 [[Chlorobium] sp. 445]